VEHPPLHEPKPLVALLSKKKLTWKYAARDREISRSLYLARIRTRIQLRMSLLLMIIRSLLARGVADVAGWRIKLD